MKKGLHYDRAGQARQSAAVGRLTSSSRESYNPAGHPTGAQLARVRTASSQPAGQRRQATLGQPPGAALSLAVAEAASSAKRFTLLLTADSQNAERLEQELRFFAPDLPVLHFPDWETLPYDVFSPHQDIISQRIAALYQLPQLARRAGGADLHRPAPPGADPLPARQQPGPRRRPETRCRADAPAPGRRRLPLRRHGLTANSPSAAR